MKKYLISIIFIATIFSQSLSSYSFNSSVSSSLAGAAVSNRLGIWSVYHNPALLVESENNSASIGYSNLYNQNFLPQSNFGLVLRTNKINLGIKFVQCLSELLFRLDHFWTIQFQYTCE